MESRVLKLATSIYLVFVSIFIHSSVVVNNSVPISVNYVSMVFLYLIPIFLVYWSTPKKVTTTIFLVLTPLVVMIAIIGPNEAGLHGFDPYLHTLTAYRAFLEDSLLALYQEGDWPLLLSLSHTLVTILNIDVATVGKYLPLIVSLVPLLFFLGISRPLSTETAFMGSIAIASGEMFLKFQTKFIEEPIAMILIITAINIVFLIKKSKRREGIVLVLLLSLTLTHHFLAAAAVSVWTVWVLIPNLPCRAIPNHISVIKTTNHPSTITSLFLIVVFVSIFIFPYLVFTGWAVLQLLGPATTAGVPGGEESAGFFELQAIDLAGFFARLRYISYLLMSAVIAVGVLSKEKITDWQLSWAIIAGMFSSIYVAIFALGKVIPLSQSRFLVLLLPALLISSISIFEKRQFSIPYSKLSVLVLVLIVVTSQLAGLSPHRINANPSEMVYPEGHYIASELSTATWGATYLKGERIIDEKPELWRTSLYPAAVDRQSVQTCSGYSVERSKYVGISEWDRPLSQNTIYSAGGISIGFCRGYNLFMSPLSSL